jgi:hypothetical protein
MPLNQESVQWRNAENDHILNYLVATVKPFFCSYATKQNITQILLLSLILLKFHNQKTFGSSESRSTRNTVPISFVAAGPFDSLQTQTACLPLPDTSSSQTPSIQSTPQLTVS